MVFWEIFKSLGFTRWKAFQVSFEKPCPPWWWLESLVGGWTQDIHLHCQLFGHASFSATCVFIGKKFQSTSSQRSRENLNREWVKKINKNEVQMIFQFLISTVVNLYDTNLKKALIRWKYLKKVPISIYILWSPQKSDENFRDPISTFTITN